MGGRTARLTSPACIPMMEMIALSHSLWHCPNSTDPRLRGEEADRNTKDCKVWVSLKANAGQMAEIKSGLGTLALLYLNLG